MNGRLRCWWQTTLLAIGRSKEFGRQIRRTADPVHHKRFLLPHVLLIYLAGYAAVVGLFVAGTRKDPITEDPMILSAGAPICGGIILLLYGMAATLTIWLTSLYYRLQGIRNVMAIAMQVSAYLAGYALLLLVLSASLGMLALGTGSFFRSLEAAIGVNYLALGLLFWGGPTLIGALGYISLVRRATHGARYANR